MTDALEPTASDSPVEADDVHELPDPVASLRRSTTIHVSSGIRDPRRHSKRLSLNFPILIPPSCEPPHSRAGSPSIHSKSPSYPSPYQLASPVATQPLTPPSEVELDDGPDFLTLIAGQERCVLELREELHKAEAELLNLKKKWAVFEANKKRNEHKTKAVKLGPVSPKTAANSVGTIDGEEERQRRKEAREKRLKGLGLGEIDSARATTTQTKRSGQRVFTGSHTRALSLLQTTAATPAEPPHRTLRQNSRTGSLDTDAIRHSVDGVNISPSLLDSSNTVAERGNLSRHSLSQEVMAPTRTGSDQLSFGKTYKDLAKVGRSSIPPGADVLVKQSKQMYEGVSQGFWNFVEDIRQATVGEEAITELAPAQRAVVKKKRSQQKVHAHEHEHVCERHGKHGAEGIAKNKAKDRHKPDKDNFWKEFGLETPQAKQQRANSNLSASNENTPPTKEHDHESKSSTDSKYPPSLLADLMDVNEDDEAWDHWPTESPTARRKGSTVASLVKDTTSFPEAMQDDGRNSTEALQPKQLPHVGWEDLTN